MKAVLVSKPGTPVMEQFLQEITLADVQEFLAKPEADFLYFRNGPVKVQVWKEIDGFEVRTEIRNKTVDYKTIPSADMAYFYATQLTRS